MEQVLKNSSVSNINRNVDSTMKKCRQALKRFVFCRSPIAEDDKGASAHANTDQSGKLTHKCIPITPEGQLLLAL